jgi:hypothetical protein
MFIGIMYAGCDCKDSSDDIDMDYLSESWTDIDTAALMIGLVLAEAVYCLQIFHGIFYLALKSDIIRYGIYAAGGVCFILIIVICS